MTIFQQIKKRLNRSKRYVFTRADFADLGGYSQVGKALQALIAEQLLLRIGYGLYTKARVNRINGRVIAASPGGSDGVVMEALDQLGVDYEFDEFSRKYLAGQINQIPARFQPIFDKNKFSRKITVGKTGVNLG